MMKVIVGRICSGNDVGDDSHGGEDSYDGDDSHSGEDNDDGDDYVDTSAAADDDYKHF